MRLSPRQTAIVSLVARDGMTYQEVADELGIHISTVRVHIGRISERAAAEGHEGRPQTVLHKVYHLFVRPSAKAPK